MSNAFCADPGLEEPVRQGGVAVAAGPPWQRGDVAGKCGRGTRLGDVAVAGGAWLRSPPLCSSGTVFVVSSQSWGG